MCRFEHRLATVVAFESCHAGQEELRHDLRLILGDERVRLCNIMSCIIDREISSCEILRVLEDLREEEVQEEGALVFHVAHHDLRLWTQVAGIMDQVVRQVWEKLVPGMWEEGDLVQVKQRLMPCHDLLDGQVHEAVQSVTGICQEVVCGIAAAHLVSEEVGFLQCILIIDLWKQRPTGLKNYSGRYVLVSGVKTSAGQQM